MSDQLISVGGFRWPNAPTQWVLAPTDEAQISLGHLLEKFYELFDFDDDITFKPLVMVRDPLDKEGKPYFGSLAQILLVMYRRGYYVLIEKDFSNIFGPHAARLHRRSERGEIVWIAVLQVENISFYSDEKILAAVTTAIQSHTFYQTDKTAQILVNL